MKTVEPPVAAASTKQQRRFFDAPQRVLFLLCGLALAVRIYVGSRTYMEFDEWQQVFMAAAPRWKDFFFELRAEAHPPLFFLLLRFVLWFGHSPLLYRAISILCGAASVIVVLRAGAMLFRSRTVAVLAAASLAFSAAAISISAEVRQYSLLAFLLLLAFSSYLELIKAEPSHPRRDFLILSGACTLAVLCHYSAILFIGASLLAGALALLEPPLFSFPSPLKWRRFGSVCFAFLPSIAVFVWLWLRHARHREPEGYLVDFYWGFVPGESRVHFIARNLQNFFNLFSPVAIRNGIAFGVVLGLLLVLSAWILFGRLEPRRASLEARGDIYENRRLDRAGAILTVGIALGITLEMLILAVARKYPFGGFLRHQYVAGPFLLLSVFVVLDRVASLIPARWRRALTGLIVAAIAANFIVSVPRTVVYPGLVLTSAEYKAYASAFPAAQAVYVDHWGVIGYFINTNEYPREFVRRIRTSVVLDQFRMHGQRDVSIFYDKSRYILDMLDPALYRTFVDCLHQGNIRELTVFMFNPNQTPFALAPEPMKKAITDLAARNGLSVTGIVSGEESISAGFSLKASQ